MEFDRKNNCMICGRTRDEIERDENFEVHVTELHSSQDYLNFITFLKEKPSIDFSGPESYVYEKLDARDNSWFPLNNTWTRGGGEGDEDGGNGGRSSELKETIQQMSEAQS